METVFCPMDFSAGSELAAEWAMMIAIKRNGRVVLFHKFVPSSGRKVHDRNNAYEEAKRESEEKLLQLKARLCEKLRANNLTCLIDSDFGVDTEDAILRSAEKARAGLIVMGTKGAESFGDIIGGSNTTGVIKQTNIPVLVIPEGAGSRLPGHMIYASDLKSEDRRNLSYVLDFAEELKAKVTFLHIKTKEEPAGLAKLKKTISDHLTHQLSTGEVGAIAFDEIETDYFLAALLKYATQKGAGMIVMGQHPKNLFEKLFEGDLTRLMALYSSIPLLILHKEE